MTNKTLYRLSGTMLCAALTMISALSAPAQQNAPTRIGDYSVTKLSNTTVIQRPNGDIEFTLRSGNAPLELRSPNYDITAPRVEILMKQIQVKGKPNRTKVTQLQAATKVKIVTRDPENGRKTVTTCDTLNYSATTDPTDRGTIRLVGNVRSEVYGVASSVGPIVSTGQTGTIKYLPDRSLFVEVDEPSGNGSFRGQLNETPPKPKGNP